MPTSSATIEPNYCTAISNPLPTGTRMLAIMQMACVWAVIRRYQLRALTLLAKGSRFGSLPKNAMQDSVGSGGVWER
jgi:hypothetical protein